MGLRSEELRKFVGILPYASELFGVYQPLLGWKSKRIASRFQKGHAWNKKRLIEALSRHFVSASSVERDNPDSPCELSISAKAGTVMSSSPRKLDSALFQIIVAHLPKSGEVEDSLWGDLLRRDRVNEMLEREVVPHYQRSVLNVCSKLDHLPMADGRDESYRSREALFASVEDDLAYESALGGTLVYLASHKKFTVLKNLFFAQKESESSLAEIVSILSAASAQDIFLSIDTINPRDKEHLKSVGLSPISVVHLFRQYFYEFDSFLGSPVGHVWLSPGSTVELIEVSTRRVQTERTVELGMETTVKMETSEGVKEELSEAVKDDNKTETKLGAASDAHQGWIGGEANASVSLDMTKTQQTAREVSHRRMREQSKKLSSEIRQNYKSTFKVVTEQSETSSKRHLLTNHSPDLINYELRRKMRQVGVQLQDIGTYLCWQAYVDDPAKDIGLAELVHIAKTPDLGDMPHPASPSLPDPYEQVEEFSIPFVGANDNDDKGEHYTRGVETDDGDLLIQWSFPKTIAPSKLFVVLSQVTVEGLDDVNPSVVFDPNSAAGKAGSFSILLDTVHFHDQPSVRVRVRLRWVPDEAVRTSLELKAKEEFEKKMSDYNAKAEREFQKEFITAAKERINFASEITPRPYEELREEERIVVYRKLIQDMLLKGVVLPDDATRHVVSELINSIFDVQKMLYFVAPEWWRPRLHQSHQNLGARTPVLPRSLEKTAGVSSEVAKELSSLPRFSNQYFKGALGQQSSQRETPLREHSVGWGGIDGCREDNYYITEKSKPARLGSSLGWLLQLDGDNLRNAFLNAPWVKAVIPVRPGKEEAAINWLKQVEGFNGIGDNDIYQTSNLDEKDIDGLPLNGQPMSKVLLDLAKKVKRKHEMGVATGTYPKQDPSDPVLVDEASTVTATPIDRVYEHGFYPLVGSFRNKPGEEHFEVFAQWVEILPTDQTVPVEVKYDPKTGKLL
jgi:replicative DNA helicase